MTTTPLSEQGEDSEGKGVGYRLPMGKVTIKVDQTEHAPVVDEETTKTAEAPAAGDKAKDKAKDKGDGTTEINIPGAQGDAPTAAGGTKQTTTTKKYKNVPPTYSISYVSTTYVPDPRQRFVVRYRPNAMFDDNVKVTLTKDGLLDMVDVTTEDRTVDVVKKVIEIAKNIGRIVAQSDSGVTTIYRATFDPTNAEEIKEINNQLSKIPGGPYSVSLMLRSSPDYKQATSTYHVKTLKKDFSGVAYRPALAYGLTLKQHEITQEVANVILPNEAEILYLPITRSAFVKKVSKLDFDQGILVEATINKPSEALGGVEIPLEITRAILALPGEIAGDTVAGFKRNSEVSTARGNATSAAAGADRTSVQERTKDIEEKTKLLKAQDEYDKADAAHRKSVPQ